MANDDQTKPAAPASPFSTAGIAGLIQTAITDMRFGRYNFGDLNPAQVSPVSEPLDPSTSTWEGMLKKNVIESTRSNILANQQIFKAIVLYAWQPEGASDEGFLRHFPEIKKATHVKARIPEIHTTPLPANLPLTNDPKDRNADWAAINAHPTFVARDTLISQYALPSPGDVVYVTFESFDPFQGPIYLGKINESQTISNNVTNPLLSPPAPGPTARNLLGGAPRGAPTTAKVDKDADPGYVSWANTRYLGKLDANSSKRYAFDCIVMHDGGGFRQSHTKDYHKVVESALRLWLKPGRASSHYYITLDGQLFVTMDESLAAWHSAAKGWHTRVNYKGSKKTASMNRRSIGIDFQWGGSKGWGNKKDFRAYTPAQMETLIRLLKDINERRKIPIDDAHLLAHFEIQNNRDDPRGFKANRPTPAFDWNLLMRTFPGITYDHRHKNHPSGRARVPKNSPRIGLTVAMTQNPNDPMQQPGSPTA